MRKSEIISLPVDQPEKERYSPEQTERIRRQSVSEIVASARDMLTKSTERINLHNVDEIVSATDAYLERCIRIGTLPSMQGLAAACGVSRRYLYKFLTEHEGTPSADYLERLRASFSQQRLEATDRGSAKEVLTIFLLKNSDQGYRDKIDVEPVQPQNPMADLDAVAARERLLAAIPDDD